MMLPHELAAKYLVPPLRALVARRLREAGLGQERIARLLGVSQAMVSKYLRRPEAEVLEQLRAAGVEPAEASAMAAALAGRLMRGDVEGYMRLATEFINSVLARGGLCELHMSRGAPAGCRICMDVFSEQRDAFIEEVMEAARLLASTPGSHRLVPNVGSNIVAARPGARSPGEVVGLTGGLVRAGSRLEIVGKPAYGGSRHTASVLLLVHRRWPRLRAAVVAAYREDCLSRLASRGLRLLHAGPHRGPAALLEDLDRALASTTEPVDVIVDHGGEGLEPVVYVLGGNAVEAVERLLECL